MGMTIDFLNYFFRIIFFISPIIVALAASIIIMGLFVGKIEKWSRFDSLYYTFITATTIGYGDMRPTKKICKILAVFIGLQGLILTGIIVASAVTSITVVAKNYLN
jgi:voltage-gated potassium channel